MFSRDTLIIIWTYAWGKMYFTHGRAHRRNSSHHPCLNTTAKYTVMLYGCHLIYSDKGNSITPCLPNRAEKSPETQKNMLITTVVVKENVMSPQTSKSCYIDTRDNIREANRVAQYTYSCCMSSRRSYNSRSHSSHLWFTEANLGQLPFWYLGVLCRVKLV